MNSYESNIWFCISKFSCVDISCALDTDIIVDGPPSLYIEFLKSYIPSQEPRVTQSIRGTFSWLEFHICNRETQDSFFLIKPRLEINFASHSCSSKNRSSVGINFIVTHLWDTQPTWFVFICRPDEGRKNDEYPCNDTLSLRHKEPKDEQRGPRIWNNMQCFPFDIIILIFEWKQLPLFNQDNGVWTANLFNNETSVCYPF